MRYFATLNGQERTIDLEHVGGTQFRIALDGGTPVEIDAERVEGSVVHLLRGTESHDVDVEEDGDALNLLVGDDIVTVELLDERKKRLKSAKSGGGSEGKALLRAPMPGKVVKVLVEVGQEITDGAGLVIIEAMKMENELRAPRAGKVTNIFVKEGQTVEGKAELVTVE